MAHERTIIESFHFYKVPTIHKFTRRVRTEITRGWRGMES